MPISKITYQYSEFNADILKIARDIERSSFNPDLIVGIVRGGLMPAVFLSQWFDIPMYAWHYSLRDHKVTESYDFIINSLIDKNVLVVDDICDAGSTLRNIQNIIDSHSVLAKSDIRYATLHFNLGQNLFVPDFYAKEINKVEHNVWIDYPWEEFWLR